MNWTVSRIRGRTVRSFFQTDQSLNWALVDQVLVSAANFAMALSLARLLGAEDFGRFSLAWLVAVYSGSVQRSAIVAPMQTLTGRTNPGRREQLWSDFLVLHVVLSVATAVLVFIGCLVVGRCFGADYAVHLALPTSVLVLTGQTQEFFRRYLFVRGSPAVALVTDVVRYVGFVAMLVSTQTVPWMEVNAVRALWLASLFCTAATGVSFLEGRVRVLRLRWSGADTEDYVQFVRWLVPSAILAWGSENLFVFSAGAILGPFAAGVIRAMQNLVGLTQIFFQGLENRVPLRAAERFREGGTTAMVAYLRKIGGLGLMITVAVAAVLLVAPDWILQMLYGHEYSGFGHLLYYMAVTQILIAIQTPLSVALRSMGETRSIFWASFWRALFSLCACYPFVRFAGLSGAAIGFVLVNGIVVGVLMHGYWKIRTQI